MALEPSTPQELSEALEALHTNRPEGQTLKVRVEGEQLGFPLIVEITAVAPDNIELTEETGIIFAEKAFHALYPREGGHEKPVVEITGQNDLAATSETDQEKERLMEKFMAQMRAKAEEDQLRNWQALTEGDGPTLN